MAAEIPANKVFVGTYDLHNLLIIVTYVVVIFSIVVQGLTVSPLIRSSILDAQEKSKKHK